MNENRSMKDFEYHILWMKKKSISIFFIHCIQIRFLCFDNKLLKSINSIKVIRMQFWHCILQFHCVAIAFQFRNSIHKISCDKKELWEIIVLTKDDAVLQFDTFYSMCNIKGIGKPTNQEATKINDNTCVCMRVCGVCLLSAWKIDWQLPDSRRQIFQNLCLLEIEKCTREYFWAAS